MKCLAARTIILIITRKNCLNSCVKMKIALQLIGSLYKHTKVHIKLTRCQEICNKKCLNTVFSHIYKMSSHD